MECDICKKNGYTHEENKFNYCDAVKIWNEKFPEIRKTPWSMEGTKKRFYDLGRFEYIFLKDLYREIMKRDRKCQFIDCTKTKQLVVHHIIPIIPASFSGSYHPKNLITLCGYHYKIQPSHNYFSAPLLLKSDFGKKTNSSQTRLGFFG